MVSADISYLHSFTDERILKTTLCILQFRLGIKYIETVAIIMIRTVIPKKLVIGKQFSGSYNLRIKKSYMNINSNYALLTFAVKLNKIPKSERIAQPGSYGLLKIVVFSSFENENHILLLLTH